MIGSDSNALLSVAGLTMRFGGLTALDDVSFAVDEGTIFSLIGPNGSGKSTAFDCISGVQRPTAGTVHLRGARISALAPHRIARLGVARTFQSVALSDDQTTVENLMLGRHLHMRTGVWGGIAMLGRRSRAAREERGNRERVQRTLELLDLVEFRERPVRELSYGIRKRVELGRALAMEPSLLLIDEPCAGTNAEERAHIADALRRLNAETGLTILMIEHHLQLALDLADRVLALSFGRSVALGTPEQVRRHPDVIRAYIGDA